MPTPKIHVRYSFNYGGRTHYLPTTLEGEAAREEYVRAYVAANPVSPPPPACRLFVERP